MTEKIGRIEYIDAMWETTMILMVYSHVCHYYLGNKTIGYLFSLFPLPFIFFICGGLHQLYHPAQPYNRTFFYLE